MLLDTNVVSELRRGRKADPRLISWAASVSSQDLFLSVMSIFEMEHGVLRIERRDPEQGKVLRSWIEQQVISRFSGRILPVDIEVAQQAARLHVPDPIAERDALIAATAIVHRLPVVTRNVRDFETTGVTLINPWEAVAN